MKYLIEKRLPFHPVIRIPVRSGLSLAKQVMQTVWSALGFVRKKPRPFYYYQEQQRFLENYELHKRKFMNSGPPL